MHTFIYVLFASVILLEHFPGKNMQMQFETSFCLYPGSERRGGGATGAVCNKLGCKAFQVNIVHNKHHICQMWLKINLSVLLDLYSSFSSLIQTGSEVTLALGRANVTCMIEKWHQPDTRVSHLFLFNFPPYQWACSVVIHVGATYCASMNCVYTNGHHDAIISFSISKLQTLFVCVCLCVCAQQREH